MGQLGVKRVGQLGEEKNVSRRGEVGQVRRGGEWKMWDEEESGTGGRGEEWDR